MSRRRLHPCRDCKRGRALAAQAHAMIEALEKMRRPAKRAGR